MISELLQTARPAIFQKMLSRHNRGMKSDLETDIQVVTPQRRDLDFYYA
jgi:hypothetical protein